jgi:spermidine synthase
VPSFFLFFFLSGFCSILYELVWLRLSMAQFGVTSALVSIVLSTFMAGLGIGSWISGRLVTKYGMDGVQALRAYAVTELLIGTSALVVPHELAIGRIWLHRLELSSSLAYYFGSGVFLALALTPWCACMGATIPLGMQAIRSEFRNESPRAFSFLYFANVLGAVAGATIPLLLIELYGFRGALRTGALSNAFIAVSAIGLSLRKSSAQEMVAVTDNSAAVDSPVCDPKILVLLFATGLTSMGMEVVWIRQFTPYLTTVVYAFAGILGTYLLSTFLGSRIYRHWSLHHSQEHSTVWMLLGVLGLLPLLAASPKISMLNFVRVALGIAPFSALLGFVTPMLVDRWSHGDPDRAGSAYAINVTGCILGPLLAGFVLLPMISERWALFVLCLPWLAIGAHRAWPVGSGVAKTGARPAFYVIGLFALTLLAFGKDYESRFHHAHVLRDHTATLIASGEGMRKQLFVNGVGITILTPATKMMAHLPLAFMDRTPRNALVICFGMGTTFRSLLSWNISTTAVELVPSVPKLFWYFHSDGPDLLRSPLAHVIIDDGRRYLERTTGQFDVITIDPPPPVEAAGSSLLYSQEFYSTLKPRLQPGGILQQWLPHGDEVDRAAVARALQQSFPYVRVFWEDPQNHWGTHFIASVQPLHNWTAADLAGHMPPQAAQDLIEWGPQPTAERQFVALLQNETSLDEMIREAPDTQALRDDKPVNEYYLARREIVPVLTRYLH